MSTRASIRVFKMLTFIEGWTRSDRSAAEGRAAAAERRTRIQLLYGRRDMIPAPLFPDVRLRVLGVSLPVGRVSSREGRIVDDQKILGVCCSAARVKLKEPVMTVSPSITITLLWAIA